MEEHGALGIAGGAGAPVSGGGRAPPSVPPLRWAAGQVSTSRSKPAAALGQQQALRSVVICAKHRGVLPSRHTYLADLIPPEASILSPSLQRENGDVHGPSSWPDLLSPHQVSELDVEPTCLTPPASSTPAGEPPFFLPWPCRLNFTPHLFFPANLL